jgi:hypothetical protein
MASIYEFWKALIYKKRLLRVAAQLGDFPYDVGILSYVKIGRGFPNFALKINKTNSAFTGGELIKIKDRNDYLISPFKSTVPTGKKNIRDIITSEDSSILHKMREAGDDVFSLEERDVYYLVRGQKKGHQKICLTHGSFFETLPADELVRQSFGQVLDEELSGGDIPEDVKLALKSLFSRQKNFSRVRNVGKASVKLRFRIMTEVKPQGNILNASLYPEIKDDTLNFLAPYYSEEQKAKVVSNMETVFGAKRMQELTMFSLKHPLNGWFIGFQSKL